MLYKFDSNNKKITITNICSSSILIRIKETKRYRITPSFSLLKLNDIKTFLITTKETENETDITIEAIQFDETQLEILSEYPWWQEKQQNNLKKQIQTLQLSNILQKSNSFYSYDRPNNQTFQEQKLFFDNSIRQDLQTKRSATNLTYNSDQPQSKQQIQSQLSLQLIYSNRIGQDQKQLTDSNKLKDALTSMNTPECENFLPKLQIPQDTKQVFDQIDQLQSPFQFQSGNHLQSQINSQTNSQKLISNENNNLSLSETTSIQRHAGIMMQSKTLKQQSVPKFKTSSIFIQQSKIQIDKQQELMKDTEDKLKKQINELKNYKKQLIKELEELKFKQVFHQKNRQSTKSSNIYIWHLLITSAIGLIFGSILKQIILFV